jgi:SAM-dependent methyltransferase
VIAREVRMSASDEPSGVSYGPGHADYEVERLRAQARLIEPMTRRWLVEAGIRPGMRVLDVGSGVGDVALLAAELVGPTGEVVGTDRVDTPLALAAERAAELRLTNIRFLKCDPAETTFDEQFDAVVGRYVRSRHGSDIVTDVPNLYGAILRKPTSPWSLSTAPTSCTSSDAGQR